MTEVVGLHRCKVAAGRHSVFALGQFYFVMVAKRECSDSECGVEALAPVEWADDFGYGDLQDALTSALQDCDADYVDGVETALLLHHPDLNADVKGALALRPVSPTDGLRLLDGRYRGVSIPFSVFALALPELGQGCFGFMLHNPSKRSILSLGD